MSIIDECLAENRRWQAETLARDPEYFERLSRQQRPDILWIGCSDSRLPPDRIIGRQPGEVFVHRNVANVVVHTDVNCLSVLQFAIEVLGVQHVIVCGHYACGGVRSAISGGRPLGLIDNWLRHIKDVYRFHADELDVIEDPVAREDRMCELNVIAQVANVCHTTIVQDAWRRGQPLTVHGWIYKVSDGLVRELGVRIDDPSDIPAVYRVDGPPVRPRMRRRRADSAQ